MIRAKYMLREGMVYWQCQKTTCGVFFESRFKRCQICAGELKAVKIKKKEWVNEFELEYVK